MIIHLRQQQQNYMQKETPRLPNPEVDQTLIPHALYYQQKQARLQAQSQRQQAQHTIAYLERQAKRQLKEAQRRKQSLQNYYTIVQSRVQDYRAKEKHHQYVVKEINQLRQINTSAKMEAATKRANARSKLENFNKQIAIDVKSFRSQSERKLIEERQLEISLLKKKNEALTSRIMEANANSRVRAMGHRRAASNEVKNDLIRLQEKMRIRQIDKTKNLNSRQEQLMRLVEKGRSQRKKYEASLSQARTMPVDKVYSQIKGNHSSRRSHRNSFL